MIKYKARINKRFCCKDEIEEVEIDKETDKSVWINGVRNAKRTEWANYYDTWEDAHNDLMRHQQRHVESLYRQFQASDKMLIKIKGMTKQ